MLYIFSQILDRVKLLFLCLFFSIFIFASVPVLFEAPPVPLKPFHESPYYLGWDLNFSPFAGGSDILFGLRCLERIEGYTAAALPIYYSKTVPARFWRLSDLFLVWLPANYFGVVVQHEVFGHGYRIRDIGNSKISVTGYHFGTPIPYGDGGGATYFRTTSSITTTDLSATSIGGIESTAILAQLTKMNWLVAGNIDPRQSVLYILSEQDITLYVGSLDSKNLDMDGHDIHKYLHTLRWTYPKGQMSEKKLKFLSLVSWLDPFTFYSAYSWFHYFWSGKEGYIPMISIGSYRYLPNARMGLTPFGPEFFLENYLVKNKKPTYFYGKGGNYGGNAFLGLGFLSPKIWQISRLHFGARFDAWLQPKLLLNQGALPLSSVNLQETPNPNTPLYPYAQQKAQQLGGAFSILCSIDAYERLGFQFELGYKTKGFLPGNALKNAPIVRGFLSLVF